MSIWIYCVTCRKAVCLPAVLDGTASLFDDIKNDLQCLHCGGKARWQSEAVIDDASKTLFGITTLTVEEYYRAMMGLGVPDEQECHKEVLETLLQDQPVRRVIGHNIPNTTRCVVERLELWDGSVVHLGASAHGATVYRITRPINHTERALADGTE